MSVMEEKRVLEMKERERKVEEQEAKGYRKIYEDEDKE